VGELFLILIGTGLVSNLVLDYMIGTDPVVAVSQKAEPALNLSLLMLLIMPAVTSFSYLLNSFWLMPLDIIYLQLISLVLLSVLVTVTIGNLTRRYRPALYARIELFIPLVIVNSAILGVAQMSIKSDYGLLGALFFGLGTALGFALVTLAITAIREKISVADVPGPFRGISVLMITFGLIAMAFIGFSGITNFR